MLVGTRALNQIITYLFFPFLSFTKTSEKKIVLKVTKNISTALSHLVATSHSWNKPTHKFWQRNPPPCLRNRTLTWLRRGMDRVILATDASKVTSVNRKRPGIPRQIRGFYSHFRFPKLYLFSDTWGKIIVWNPFFIHSWFWLEVFELERT